jgi:hypothetical protein
MRVPLSGLVNDGGVLQGGQEVSQALAIPLIDGYQPPVAVAGSDWTAPSPVDDGPTEPARAQLAAAAASSPSGSRSR